MRMQMGWVDDMITKHAHLAFHDSTKCVCGKMVLLMGRDQVTNMNTYFYYML